MDITRFRRVASVALAVVAMLGIAGCAGTVTRWMVDLRTAQGDAALQQKSLTEAEKEYALALKLDPRDMRARAGLAKVLFLQARADFTSSKLDEAQVAIEGARTYAPDDVATQALANEIDQAKIRRAIVLANYPLYESVGTSLADSTKTLTATQKEMAKQIKAFGSDFDVHHITKAIVASYNLEDEAHRATLRLMAYRGLVTTGSTKPGARPQTGSPSDTPSLLPIP